MIGGPTQGVDPDRVSKWLADNVKDIELPVRFDLIAGGRSNLTYRSQTQPETPLPFADRLSAMSCLPRTTWPASTG
jgi:hypothetical protein